MAVLDDKREFEFYSRLLDLCKDFGVGVRCSDPCEVIDIIPYSEDFVEEYTRIYLCV